MTITGNITGAVLVMALFALGMSMVGCTANLPIRTSLQADDVPGVDPTKAVIETTPDYKLGIVEFDDQGWFWIPQQRVVVEQMIRQQAGLGAELGAGLGSGNGGSSQGIILVAFVHGWKDNAQRDNDGLKAFRGILTQLNKAEQAQQDHPARKVVGVYGAWRGLSATWEPFKELSIWDRKDTAHKVGGYGAMTQLLVDLDNIQKESLEKLPPNAPRTELIIIGHSLGAAAVYSGVSQILTARFADAILKHERLKPLGDQIILLNPAFEAGRHYNLDQMAHSIEHYPADQRPVLSIFTSKGDWATHYVFPISRYFSTIFDKYRDAAQRKANVETVGWYEPFVTHELIYRGGTRAPATQTSTLNLATLQHELSSTDRLLASHENIKAQRSKWQPGDHPPRTYDFDDTVLRPLNGFHPGDPFLVVSVDKPIMEDHNDINNPVLINFIREYIQFCQVEPHDHSK